MFSRAALFLFCLGSVLPTEATAYGNSRNHCCKDATQCGFTKGLMIKKRRLAESAAFSVGGTSHMCMKCPASTNPANWITTFKTTSNTKLAVTGDNNQHATAHTATSDWREESKTSTLLSETKDCYGTAQAHP